MADGKLEFRKLEASEIDIRVAQINEKGCQLLLYKDARCDMCILDETVGALNWQRRHNRDNANCVVSIYNSNLNTWVEKEDTGTESNTEADKGLASDSFKRACVNWGIGRELYTAPFIWIPAEKVEIKQNRSGKPMTYDKFEVQKIAYDDKRNIVGLAIRNAKNKKLVFLWQKENPNGDHSGKIVDVVDDGLVVFVPYGDMEKIIKRQYNEVQVGLPDGRRISPEQRRKAYALMGEIAEAVGYEKDEIKDVMKHDFVSNHLQQLEKELFSLSDCDMTTAKEYISYLIDFILRNDIPTHVPLIELADDIDRYVYACLMRKKCCICGQKADFHHVDAVGMGNDRNEVQHIGRKCFPLCRAHHVEIHTIGTTEFCNRYHIRPQICDEKIAKVYRLRSKG